MASNTNARAGMGIGAVSAATGCHIETIRYYERVGVMPPAPRTPGGRRLYDEGAVRRLRLIRRSRELGFPLRDIRALAALAEGGAGCGEARVLALRHLAGIDARIKELERLARLLSATAERCRGGTAPACPVIDLLS